MAERCQGCNVSGVVLVGLNDRSLCLPCFDRELEQIAAHIKRAMEP